MKNAGWINYFWVKICWITFSEGFRNMKKILTNKCRYEFLFLVLLTPLHGLKRLWNGIMCAKADLWHIIGTHIEWSTSFLSCLAQLKDDETTTPHKFWQSVFAMLFHHWWKSILKVTSHNSENPVWTCCHFSIYHHIDYSIFIYSTYQIGFSSSTKLCQSQPFS